MEKMKRYGMLTSLMPEKVAYYKELHSAVWPEVLKVIKACHIQNYSIYLKEVNGNYFLFSYFEYAGDNFDIDMEKMSRDSTTLKWWKQTASTQIPLPDAAAKNEVWSNMEEVFHIK